MRKFTGKIICERINVGSKSEMDGYFIELDFNGRRERIEFRAEGPSQPTLKSLVGKHCEVECEWFWKMFVAKTITEVK